MVLTIENSIGSVRTKSLKTNVLNSFHINVFTINRFMLRMQDGHNDTDMSLNSLLSTKIKKYTTPINYQSQFWESSLKK